ncbi:zinc-binding dehydrogenase [Tenacibaculum aiptasiae]
MLLNDLNILFEQNKLKTVIDKTFSLSNIISAHQYLETDYKVGNIVIINN